MSMVGFDFGTTNSLISIIEGDGRATHFLDERNRPIPSAAGYEGTRKILGRAAKERLSEAGLGVHGNIVRSPKKYLGRDSITIDGTRRHPVDIVADVVRHVCELATSSGRTLDSVTNAVVTIPVDMEGYKRRALRDAFAQAGVRIAQFVHEPFAALYGFFQSGNLSANLDRYAHKLVLVFDWGGGTLDLTLCRIIGDTVVQVMNDGTDEVGGDVFDENVMRHIVTKVAQEKGLSDETEIQPGAKERLLEACESAKIALSGRSNADVYVWNFFGNTDDDDLEYTLTAEELEEAVGSLLKKGFSRIDKVLADAGFGREEVDLCLATGGMSNMPAVRERLHAWFGPQRVSVPDKAASLIAEGAARIAADNASLHLAKNVELELARSSYLPLLKAGTRMPRGGTVTQPENFHLYCTDPRDGKAKFQICAPRRAGRKVRPNEPRTYLETMTVRVDAMARMFQERLELTVQVDEDLILHAHARSLNEKDDDRCEIHNLEFGLRLRNGDNEAHEADEEPTDEKAGQSNGGGALTVRANVTNVPDPAKIPGEYLYQLDPGYFDQRQRPPEEQNLEKLYYQPCSGCGRASNDPACRCASELYENRDARSWHRRREADRRSSRRRMASPRPALP